MQKHLSITLTRIEQFIERFTKLIYRDTVPLRAKMAGPVDRISYRDAQKLTYKNVSPGTPLPGLWNTYWFRLEGELPKGWRGQTVCLLFNTHSEGLVWWNGQPLQGVNYQSYSPLRDGSRKEVRLPRIAAHGRIALEVEVACNGISGGTTDRQSEYPHLPLFVFEQADLALIDDEAFSLFHDLFVPFRYIQLQKDLPSTPRFGRILARLNQVCNEVTPEDKSTWSKARALLKEIYAQRNASYVHEISALGHAHIDTAWLWPLDETRRKCVRTFSSVLHYMERYPDFKFSCSQAFQYQWIKDGYPRLYARIKQAIKRGQWVPVGGSWIEPDCNIPSGESLVRQFLYGKRFFRQEFGWDCKEFWNPDVFGYSGALPQILRGADMPYFLTQKLSWNQFNKPKNQNFLWEGIDGSRVLTHFPPSNTYNAMVWEASIWDLLRHERNAMDDERTNQGMLLFGYGDGGGGPTPHMLEVLKRVKDFQGLPRTEQRTSLEFFQRLEKSLTDAPVLRGELYFELHRGTYTTQAANKRDNRRSEFLLRSAEILNAVQHWKGAIRYPQAELEKLWKVTLLNQFHDILPGSSIDLVYQDSARDYAIIIAGATNLRDQAAKKWSISGPGVSVLNTCGWDREGVAEIDPMLGLKSIQKSFRGKPLVHAQAPSMGVAPLDSAVQPEGPLEISSTQNRFILENNRLRAEFSQGGPLLRLYDKLADREAVAPGQAANQFVLFEDRPTAWDAWDVDVFHLETRKPLAPAIHGRIIERGPLRVGLEFTFTFGKSKLTERVFLSRNAGLIEFETELDWQERETFLKAEFPVLVQAPEASYEIQFGQLKRPTHFNTTYDLARFEVSAHKWIDLSESGYGVALITDSKYGYSTHENVMRISLLRGTTGPDPKADLGKHAFRFAVYPHAGGLDEAEVVRRAFEFNNPWITVPGRSKARSLFSVDSPDLVLDTIKKAEDSDDLIVRLYEAHGTHGRARLKSSLDFSQVARINLLEEKQKPVAARSGAISFTYRPFEIITFSLSR